MTLFHNKIRPSIYKLYTKVYILMDEKGARKKTGMALKGKEKRRKE